MIKKANKGVQPQVEYLANCSTMKGIIREAANMNIITDKAKTPAKLRYRVSDNSGTINKEFGKNQQAAYDFANEMKETAPYADILLLNIEGNGKRIRYSLIMYLNNQLSRRGEQQADRHRRRELFINLKIKRHGKYIKVVSY